MSVRIIVTALLILYTQVLQAQQPNILFILADDMSYPYTSVYGDQVVKTPNLERLAQYGITFTNTFSTCESKSL
jgi:membrane-anchored protein YejM (alkaline phosphatase superfamily)